MKRLPQLFQSNQERICQEFPHSWDFPFHFWILLTDLFLMI